MEPNLKKFCSTECSDREHEEGLSEVIRMLSNGTISIVDVVQSLGPYLTNGNELLRSRGTLLLVILLEKLPVACIDGSQLNFIQAFFRDRSRDRPCVSEVIRGMNFLVRRWPLSLKDVELMVTTVFGEVYVQVLDQETRMIVLKWIEAVLDLYPDVPKTLKNDFVYGYLQIIDAERDPRNLFLIFSLTPKVLSICSGWDHFTEELFDVTSCYYPIKFTPKAGDSITPELLSQALDSAMTCAPQFASLYYPFILEKLTGAAEPDVANIVKSIIRSIGSFKDGGKSFLPYGEKVGKELLGLIFSAASSGTVETVCGLLKELVGILSNDLVTSSGLETSLDPILNPLIKAAIERIAVFDSKDSAIAGRLLFSLVKGSVDCSRRILGKIIPFLLEKYTETDKKSDKEVIVGHFLGMVRATAFVVESTGAVPRKAHPLYPFAETLYKIARAAAEQALIPSFRKIGFDLLSSLCCIEKLLEVSQLGESLCVVLDWCLKDHNDIENEITILELMAKRLPAVEVVMEAGVAKLLHVPFQNRDVQWQRCVAALCSGGGAIFSAIWSKLLRDSAKQNLSHLRVVCNVVQSVNIDENFSKAASEIFPDLLLLGPNNPIVPETVLEITRLLSESQQVEIAVPGLLKVFDQSPSIACAGLCGLFSSVVISEAEKLTMRIAHLCCDSQTRKTVQDWAGWCLGNLFNKSQAKNVSDVLDCIINQGLQSESGLETLGKIGRGLMLCGNSANSQRVLEVLCQNLGSKERVENSTRAIEIVFGDQIRWLSSSTTHAVARLFSRQKAFAFVIPILSKGSAIDAYVRAMALVLLQVPPAMLLGELDAVLPILLHAVKDPNGHDDVATLTNSIQALTFVLEAEPSVIAAHADTLLPNVGQMFTHTSAEVRKAALQFVQRSLELLPYTRIFPIKDRIFQFVKKALDDPRREIRRSAQMLSNKLYTNNNN